MRNRLIHGYVSVNLQIVWDTVVAVLPAMADEFAQAFVLPGETCPNRTLRVAML